MTKEEFIKKWVVAYESKEQQIEFANEMKADLEGIITAENTRLREALEGFIKIRQLIEYKEPIKEKHYGEAQAIWNAINKATQALK